MIRPYAVIFCEKIMLLANQQSMIIGPHPGAVMFNAPPGNLLPFDVFLIVVSPDVGDFSTDYRFLTTDGSVVGEIGGVKVSFTDPEIQHHLNIQGIACKVDKPGKIVLQFRLSGTDDDWEDFGSLAVRFPVPAAFPQGTKFEIPPGMIS